MPPGNPARPQLAASKQRLWLVRFPDQNDRFLLVSLLQHTGPLWSRVKLWWFLFSRAWLPVDWKDTLFCKTGVRVNTLSLFLQP